MLSLMHFTRLFASYTSWRHQKLLPFVVFSGGVQTIAPEENCHPPDNCPIYNCPLDDCPQITAPRTNVPQNNCPQEKLVPRQLPLRQLHRKVVNHSRKFIPKITGPWQYPLEIDNEENSLLAFRWFAVYITAPRKIAPQEHCPKDRLHMTYFLLKNQSS